MVVFRPGAAVAQTAVETLSGLLIAAGVEIVQLSGTPERPRAIIRTNPVTIDQLIRLHGDRLLIAPDSSLTIFSSDPASIALDDSLLHNPTDFPIGVEPDTSED